MAGCTVKSTTTRFVRSIALHAKLSAGGRWSRWPASPRALPVITVTTSTDSAPQGTKRHASCLVSKPEASSLGLIDRGRRPNASASAELDFLARSPSHRLECSSLLAQDGRPAALRTARDYGLSEERVKFSLASGAR